MNSMDCARVGDPVCERLWTNRYSMGGPRSCPCERAKGNIVALLGDEMIVELYPWLERGEPVWVNGQLIERGKEIRVRKSEWMHNFPDVRRGKEIIRERMAEERED